MAPERLGAPKHTFEKPWASTATGTRRPSEHFGRGVDARLPATLPPADASASCRVAEAVSKGRLPQGPGSLRAGSLSSSLRSVLVMSPLRSTPHPMTPENCRAKPIADKVFALLAQDDPNSAPSPAPLTGLARSPSARP